MQVTVDVSCSRYERFDYTQLVEPNYFFTEIIMMTKSGVPMSAFLGLFHPFVYSLKSVYRYLSESG